MMETQRGRQVPVVKDFHIEGSWAPATPAKPNVARPSPIYDDGQGGLLTQAWEEQETHLSRYTQQNNAQTLLAYSISSAERSNYPTTSNSVWDNGNEAPSLSGRINLQNGNGGGIQRRGLEDHLPHWSSQGRRSVMSYGSNVGSTTSYPRFSSWDLPMPWNSNGGRENGIMLDHNNLTDSLGDFNTMSFGDLLGISESLPMQNNGGSTSNGMFSENWVSQLEETRLNNMTSLNNQDGLRQIHQQNNGFYDQGIQNDALSNAFWSMRNANSTPTPKHANGSTVFAPETPGLQQRVQSQVALDYSQQRIQNHVASEYTHQGANLNNQNVLQEHEVAAAMIDLQDHQNKINSEPIADSSPGKAAVAVEETPNPDKGAIQDIDLNKTPQKKPRRRRYCPKVIRENKPKPTLKPKTPKPSDPKDTQVKRKYVRKSKTDTPSTVPSEEAAEPKPTEQASKSCRKSLNFDLNGQATEHSSLHMPNCGLETEPQARGYQEKANTSHPVYFRQEEELMIKTSISAYDLNRTMNQELREYMALPVQENGDSSDMKNSPGQKVKNPCSLSRKNAESYIGKEYPSAQNPICSPCASSSEGAQTRGSKRSLSYTTEPTYNNIGIGTITQSTPWQPNHTSSRTTFTEILLQSFIPEICKKKRTEKIQRLHMHSTSSFTAASEDRSQVNKAHSQPQVELDASKYYYCNPAPTGINGVTNSQAVLMARSEIMEQLPNSWADLSRLKKKRTKGTTRVRDLAPLTGLASAAKGARRKKVDSMSSQYPSTATLNGVFSCAEALAADTSATPRSKRRSKKQDSVSNNWGIVPYGSNPPTEEATGSIPALPWKKCSAIEELTDLLQQLDLNGEKRKISNTDRQVTRYRGKKQEQNKLVLYEQNGPIVPFEGPFNPIRKRRQRARVDLDDETTRVWRLLLENIDNEGINGTDEDKAKWWENERRVFRGRVDSFIARMRLVQGDRRFTPWKGSVLDSVIGVFLTQNVSDHLSSSAFMSMAARFPLKPESSGSTLSEEATSAFFVEPEICEPEESISWNEKAMGQPTLDRNSRVIYDFDNSEEKEVVNSKEQIGKGSPVSPTECSSEAGQKAPDNSKAFNSNSQTAETETACVIGDDKARDDASSSQQSAISSQNSIDSTNVQTVGMVNTSSESNSKAQFLTTSSKFDLESGSCFMELLKMAESQQHLQNQYGGMKHVTGYYQEAPGVSSSNYQLNLEEGFQLQDAKGIEMLEVESRSDASRKDENSPTTVQSNLTSELADQEGSPDSFPGAAQNMSSCYVLEGETMVIQSQMQKAKEPLDAIASSAQAETSPSSKGINVPLSSQQMADVIESTRGLARTKKNKEAEQIPQQNYASVPLSSQQMADVIESTRGFERTKKNIDTEQIPQHNYASGVLSDMANTNPSKAAKGKAGKGKKNEIDWDSLRREAQVNGKKPQTPNTRDSLDWEAVRHAKVNDIAETIKERGMNNMLAERIKDLLDRLVKDHGSIDMEWLRDIPPDKAKEYLLSFRGLGLKSVECVRLLTLHHLAFPVDTNVGRIAVRLGWVPLQPLPESLQLHLLEMYPVLESIQKYLWPRLCKLDQKTLYELHYHMITFGKVFCTKRQPNCNACPLRAECRHFASAFASARFALPGPEEKSIVPSSGSTTPHVNQRAGTNLLLPSTASWSSSHNNHSNPQGYNVRTNQVPSFPLSLPFAQDVHLERKSINSKCEPIVEVPASPEQESQHEQALCDIEDAFYEDPNEIPTIDLNLSEFSQTLQNFMHANRELQEAGLSNALVSLTAEAASIPTPKLKNINRLRTEHHVYELPDSHPLLRGLEKRELDDPCSYLLAIWTPGETANSIDPPARRCSFNDPNMLCNEETCSYCSSQREADSQIVRGTLLIPTRTAMRGSFPLNGTYFQVNEVFADHDSSLNPIAVPRSWLWNLPRRTVYFGTSIPTIFRGLNTEDIQHCFWRGYVCVRGFDQKTRSPRPLMARLHFPASRLARGGKGKTYDE